MFLCRIFRRSVFAGILILCAPVQAFAGVCAPHFSEKLCVSEFADSRACAPLPDSYKQFKIEEQLNELFQLSPEMVQLEFCRVESIRIVRKWGENPHSGFVHARTIVIDRTFLFEVASMPKDIAFRRDTYFFPGYTDRPFRRLKDGYAVEKKLTGTSDPVQSSISYEFMHFMLHELAHLIDFDFAINPSATTGYFACMFASQILSGKGEDEIGYTAVFPEQFGEKVDSAAFQALAASPYASFYGASWFTEDFAELFADYVLLEHFGINYTIEKQGEVLFDRAKQFENANIQNKLAIVKKVLEWPRMSAAERQAFADDRTHCRGIFSPSAV